MADDLVQCAVLFQLGQSIVQLLSQFIVALLVGNGIFFLCKGIVQNFQGIVLCHKCLCRLAVDDNSIQLALLQSLYGICTLIIRFYGGIFYIAGIDIAGGSQLCTDLLAFQIICTEYSVGRSAACRQRYCQHRACCQKCDCFRCFFHM